MLLFWQPLRPFGPPYFIVQLPLAIVYPNRYAILTQGRLWLGANSHQLNDRLYYYCYNPNRIK